MGLLQRGNHRVFLIVLLSSVTLAGAVSFEHDVLPVLESRSFDLQKALGVADVDLSFAGADPDSDYAMLTRVASGRLIDARQPQRSLLLKILRGDIPSQTRALPEDSKDYQLVETWVENAVPRADTAALTELHVSSSSLEMKPGGTGSIQVLGQQDGELRDVTHLAKFTSNADSIAVVDSKGNVTAVGAGDAAISVQMGRRQWGVALRVLYGPPEKPVSHELVIDQLVENQLAALGLSSAGVISDASFLRRCYLRVTGRLPDATTVKAFLSNNAPDKRAQLIEKLLESPEFVELRCLYLGDVLRIKSEFPSNLWPNAVQAYYQWVYNAVASNMPYDEFARKLMTAQGSNFRDPPANFYRALRKRDPDGFAEAILLIFHGQRLNRPGDFTVKQQKGLADFFTDVCFKHTKEWKEEIVYLSPANKGEPRFPDGQTPENIGADRRVAFADWITANPAFARCLVNRVWFQLFGQGLVEEVDNMSSDNPASNPELMDALTAYVIEHHYDVKSLYRLILESETFQRSTPEQNSSPALVRHYSHYPLQRMDAEVLLDTISQICGQWESYTSRVPEPYTFMPKGTRAVQLADGSIGCEFLSLFGRPPRDSSFISERSRAVMMRQALQLLNSQQINGKISKSGLVKRLSEKTVPTKQAIQQLFLTVLTRRPDSTELKRWTDCFASMPNRRAACEDLLWTLLNTKEFLYIQ